MSSLFLVDNREKRYINTFQYGVLWGSCLLLRAERAGL
jgi:hypothetical protein